MVGMLATIKAQLATSEAQLVQSYAKIATAKSRIEASGVMVAHGLVAISVPEIGGTIEVPEKALGARKQGVIFKADTGATNHFVGEQVVLTDQQHDSTRVEIADGNQINIARKGKFSAMATNGTGTVLTVKQAPEFSQNLFSIFEATKHGWTATFDAGDSYLVHGVTRERIPLVRTATGWDLELFPTANGAGTAASAQARPAQADETPPTVLHAPDTSP
jgi:hypothetical protein